jgi:hypothetical protein
MQRLVNKISSLLNTRYFFDPGIKTREDTEAFFGIRRLKDIGEKPVYIIYRAYGGSGFFSNVLHVYRHIEIAERYNFVPVVDFVNYPTIYSLDGNPEHSDSWNSYFEPVSEISLKEAYDSPNLILCNGRFPANASMCYDVGNQSSFERFFKYIEIRRKHLDEINGTLNELEIKTKRTLGVHWRGNEQNRAKGHWFGPTKGQIFKQVDTLLATGDYDQIFISTESHHYLNLMIKRYGNLIKHTNYPRSNRNVYKYPIRKDHYFLLGKEILNDAVLLANCRGLIHSDSNVSDFAAFYNNNNFRDRIFIDNGENKSKLSLIAYTYKQYLPATFGGLKNNIIKYRNDSC